jgi:hypothetical protein
MPTSCAVLNLYSLFRHNSPVNHLFNTHATIIFFKYVDFNLTYIFYYTLPFCSPYNSFRS